MRFNDWDVLLFPQGSHVPMREFRTACFAQQDPRTMTTTPLLTCFTPSLTTSAPFQISVHSWTKPTSILGAENAGYVPGTTYLWRVKIVVDGATVASETYGEDVSWPKQLDASSATDAEGKHLPLSFPRFHRTILSQSHWNATDDLGRIKLQLSAGYQIIVDGKPQFVKLVDHVVFSFQPVPTDILERSGIAWPNPNLPVVNNPLQAPDARRPSLGAGMLPVDEASSRSTSGYSVIPHTAYPLEMHAPYPGAAPQVMMNPQTHLRLPSGQLQRIIDALSPSNAAAALSMPPPPVPQRHSVGSTTPVMDRRGHNYSDISMHASCNSFPSCLSEDADGHLVHANPSSAVRGRKEGPVSSPTKPRDFLPTVMDTPVATAPTVTSPPESSAKKRTRSALRSLTLNDNGSPEKREKPARKVSKTSASEAEKEQGSAGGEDKENVAMVD